VPVRPFRLLAATTLGLLIGCGGGSGNPDGGGGGGNTTVNGQVLDNFGLGRSGASVIVGGKSATTDSTGHFTVSGIATPYDAVILGPAADKTATIYTQLTRTDPKLLDFDANNAAAHSASVGGALTGGDAFPTPQGTFSAVSWGSPEASTGTYVTVSPYSFGVDWSGPTTTTGTLRGLQWTIDSNGTVTGYDSHGTRTAVSLAANGTVSNADIALSTVLTTPVSVTITPPGTHQITERDLTLNFADGTYFPVSADGLSDTAYTVPVPSGIGATATVKITALENDAGTVSIAQVGLQPGGSTSLSLPNPAVTTAPADGATGVDTNTDLIWTPVAGGIHVLFLIGAGNDPTYVILSGGTRTRIPDLSAQGLGLPAGRPYDLTLFGIGPYASLDAFAQNGTIPREGLGFQTGSATRFTTK
jgi:hypothetical protein